MEQVSLFPTFSFSIQFQPQQTNQIVITRMQAVIQSLGRLSMKV